MYGDLVSRDERMQRGAYAHLDDFVDREYEGLKAGIKRDYAQKN